MSVYTYCTILRPISLLTLPLLALFDSNFRQVSYGPGKRGWGRLSIYLSIYGSICICICMYIYIYIYKYHPVKLDYV